MPVCGIFLVSYFLICLARLVVLCKIPIWYILSDFAACANIGIFYFVVATSAKQYQVIFVSLSTVDDRDYVMTFEGTLRSTNDYLAVVIITFANTGSDCVWYRATG